MKSPLSRAFLYNRKMKTNSGFIANLIIIGLTALIGSLVFFIYSSKSPLNNDDTIRILDDEQIAKFDEINLHELPDTVVKVDTGIDSFEKCLEAGFEILESYPRKCNDGVQTYIEDVKTLGIRLQEPERDDEILIPFSIKGSIVDSSAWNISERYAGVFEIIDSEKRLLTPQKIVIPFINNSASTTGEFETSYEGGSWIGEMQTTKATLFIEEVAIAGDDKKQRFNIPISFPESYLSPKIDVAKWKKITNDNFKITYSYPNDWNYFGSGLSGTQALISTLESPQKFEGEPRFFVEIIAFDGTRYTSFLDVILQNSEVVDGNPPADINDFEKVFINQRPVYGIQTHSIGNKLGYSIFVADPRNDVVYRFKLLARNVPPLPNEQEYGFRVLKALAESLLFE